MKSSTCIESGGRDMKEKNKNNKWKIMINFFLNLIKDIKLQIQNTVKSITKHIRPVHIILKSVQRKYKILQSSSRTKVQYI